MISSSKIKLVINGYKYILIRLDAFKIIIKISCNLDVVWHLLTSELGNYILIININNLNIE